MREELLYHIWKFQKFENTKLYTREGERLIILHPGSRNDLAGPDFFNARIELDQQVWAGNVEIHVNASHWFAHAHETNPDYDSVILHVVWEYDAEVRRTNGSLIPTLVLKDYVDSSILEAFHDLLDKPHKKLNCEDTFPSFEDFQVNHWLERLYFERLERKSQQVEEICKRNGYDWESSLFIFLFRSFGLNQNAEAFTKIAESIPYRLVKRHQGDSFRLEALFLGQAGLIEVYDPYGSELEKEYQYLKHKYGLRGPVLPSPQFFRLRPDNFPNIRLAQLAAIFSRRSGFFEDLISVKRTEDLQSIFSVELPDYWKHHYNFGKPHPFRQKKITGGFLELISINCLVPFKYLYSKSIGKEDENCLSLIWDIPVERNSVVNKFNKLRPGIAKNAMDSQALIQLNSEYCTNNRCLECELGASLLKRKAKYP